MNCPNCHTKYNSSINLPRILIKCGHTFCQSCLTMLYSENKIKCPSCLNETYIIDINNLTKNLALLDNLDVTVLNTTRTFIKTQCSIHSRDLEAYCENDKSTLCVSCIIENDHKNHDLTSIDKAVQKEKANIEEAYSKSLQLGMEVNRSIIKIEQLKNELDEKAQKNIKGINEFFNEITNYIDERKNILSKKIQDVLNEEKENLSVCSEQLKRQIKLIEILNEEKNKCEEMNDFEILSRAKQNSRLLKEIITEVPKLSINEVKFYEIKKIEEISNFKIFFNKSVKEKDIDKEKSYHSLNHLNQDILKPESFNLSKKQKDTDRRISELNKALYSFKKEDKIKSLKIMKNKNLEINLNINANINNIQKLSPKNTEDQIKYLKPQIPLISKKKNEIIKKPKSNRSSLEDKLSVNSGSAKKSKTPEDLKMDNTISLSSSMFADSSDKYIKRENKEFIIDELAPQFEITPLKKTNEDSFNLMTEIEDFGSEKPNQDFKFQISNSKSFQQQDLASLYHEYCSNIIILGGKADICTRKYGVESNTWNLSKMIIHRSDFVALMYKERKILIMGGKVASSLGTEIITDTIELFNMEENSLNKLDIKLKYPRSNFGSVYLNNTIYVTGGYNGRDVLNNFEYFDKKNKKWIDLPKMSMKRKELCLIIGPNSSIYCIGGSDEKEVVSKSVEKYDFEKGNWCKIEDMNQNRKAACAVFMPDGIYVMGGYDGCQYLKSCEKYDFQGRKWKYISDMNYSKCHFSAVTSNDFQFIYTIGGYDSRPLSYIERFDVLSNKWEIIDKLPAPKYRHQSVFVNE